MFCTINFTTRSKLFDIFSNITKLFLDRNNDDIRVKLFDFAAGQLTMQITRELFMNEKIATKPAELVRQLLHLLKLPGDQSITIDVIE